MLGKPEIRFCDELPVEPLLSPTGLIARHDCPPFWVESEGCAPFAIGSFKPQLLHIGVFRAFE